MTKKKFIVFVCVAWIIGFIFSAKYGFSGVLVDTHFNSLDESGMGCVQYITSPANGATISSSQTDTPDSSNELQFYYPKGLQGNGSSGGKCWFVPNGPLTEFYIQYYIKLNAGWDWHPVNQKLIYIYTPSHVTHITTYAGSGSPGNFIMSILTNTRDLYASDPNFYFQTGRWYKIYQHYKMNTPDVANGIVQMWVDDILQINISNAVILTSSLPSGDTGLSDFDVSPVWGGVANVYKSHDDYMWFDHLTISTNPINAVTYGAGINSLKSPNSPYNLLIK